MDKYNTNCIKTVETEDMQKAMDFYLLLEI